MIGTKLAHYEITSHLGTGGMGEVYQATDSKLGRNVAIKLLPEAFTHDADRAARFEREARVLASLNHPNIAAIYGIEQSGDRKFLVMELAGGETLAECIKRGPIPVDESLGIAKQICEALEAAHEKGIVHRDLKPANIKITPDGTVKVLDFGLAKAFEAEASKANLSQSPTLSMAATNAGMILGTAAYMSPEQAKGRTVDKRTDIFALGCIFYEMLIGRAVFEGEDIPEILSRVLQRNPDWTLLPANVPPRIRELLRLCLEKNAKNRRADATDIRLDIEQALAEPAAALLADTHIRSERLSWLLAGVFALVAVVFAIPAVRHFRETLPPDAPEMRTEIVTPATSDPASFALSPDGRQLVFVASSDGPARLWLRSLASTTAQPLAGTEGASVPFWSPDSRSVGFFAGGKLKRLDLGDGRPQTLADAAPRGGTWNAAGVILFARTTTSPLFRVSASGGEAVAVKIDQPSGRLPYFLPDGRQFLFYRQAVAVAIAGIYLGSLDSTETKRLTAADSGGVYMRSGWLLWVRAGTLVAQRLDLKKGELAGDLVTVADPVPVDVLIGVGPFSVSATGLLAYRTGSTSKLQLSWFDRSGKALGTMGAPDENSLRSPNLSPDGRRVSVFRTVQGNRDLWLLDGTRLSRFTFDAASDQFPIWSPDGSRLVFDSSIGGGDLYIKPSSGAGKEELLLESPQVKRGSDWSADGRFILYESSESLESLTDRDLWVLPMDGDRKPWVFLKTNFDEKHGQFSPDGRWVAYTSNESGRLEIYVRPFVEPGASRFPTVRASGQWQVSTAGGIHPRWRRDGKELYYISPDGQLMAASVTARGTTLEPGKPEALFQKRIFGGGDDIGTSQQYDVAPDGRFLISTVLDDASPITLLLNWQGERGK